MTTEKTKSFGAYRPRGRIAHVKGPAEERMLIEHLCRELSNTTESQLRFLIDLGAVYINKKRAMDFAIPVRHGDLVRVHLEPKRYPIDVNAIRSSVVFENDHFVIINKPSGIPMHATLDNAKENIAESFDQKLFVTHRLDVPTSGLVLLAKNKLYQAKFNELIAKRAVNKTYQALTSKVVSTGIHKHYMLVSDRAPKTLLDEAEFLAIVNYEPLDECLLEVVNCQPIEFDLKHSVKILAPGFESIIKLITGRTHQIRAQLSALGSAIVGDEMYGGMPAPIFGLHSCALEFKDPINEKILSFENKKTWS